MRDDGTTVMGYLSEVTYGNYASNSEDRLSQIFSASFNHSSIFKKAILSMLGVSYRVGYNSTTQEFYDVRGRTYKIDISLKHKKHTHIIIENKVDSVLTARQLKNYNTIPELRNVRKVCIVRKTEWGEKYPDDWTILHWHDVHLHLKSKYHDDFFARNFMEILEEHNMMIPEKIAKAELIDLTKAIHNMRYKSKPFISLDRPAFEAIIEYKAMLNALWEEARRDAVLRKKVGRNFRCCPWLGSWWDEGLKRGEKAFVWIGWEVRLARAYKGIKYIGTGVEFDDREDWYSIRTYVTGSDREYIKPLSAYRKKDLVFADYAKQVIAFWKRRLE